MRDFMIIYIYKKCSTCQNAVRFLEQQKIHFTIKEIQLTPPSVKELQQMLEYKKGELKKLFNTSGLVYKEMQLSQKLPEMTVAEALKLLILNGMLIKRPFVLVNNDGLLGFKEAEWSQKIREGLNH